MIYRRLVQSVSKTFSIRLTKARPLIIQRGLNTNLGQHENVTGPESLKVGHDVENSKDFLRVCYLKFLDLRLRVLTPTEASVKLSQFADADVLSLRPLNVGNLIQG